jgi:hypothetical protein
MNWDGLTRQWRRLVDHLKSTFESGSGDSEDDSADSTLLGKGWRGNDGRIAFPPVLEPAMAKIPRR